MKQFRCVKCNRRRPMKRMTQDFKPHGRWCADVERCHASVDRRQAQLGRRLTGMQSNEFRSRGRHLIANGIYSNPLFEYAAPIVRMSYEQFRARYP